MAHRTVPGCEFHRKFFMHNRSVCTRATQQDWEELPRLLRTGEVLCLGPWEE